MVRRARVRCAFEGASDAGAGAERLGALRHPVLILEDRRNDPLGDLLVAQLRPVPGDGGDGGAVRHRVEVGVEVRRALHELELCEFGEVDGVCTASDGAHV